ncbi:MAG: hypothetical protein E7391_03930 [Ruminococcaceae bacterium]|nr:hypothetical protein [Oscillospiraceae bacterium]
MGYKSSFKMGKTYGSADLNEITKTFVSGGVGDTFEDGIPYNLKSINDIIAASGSSGIVSESNNSLKVEITDGKVKINPGRAILNDGSICIVDEECVYLDYTQNSVNFVYILNNDLTNDNEPTVSLNLPGENADYVLLATIDEEGNITNERHYAKGKIAAQSSNLMGLAFYTEVASCREIIAEGELSTVICDDITGFNYALIKWESNDGNYYTIAFVDLGTNITACGYRSKNVSTMQKITSGNTMYPLGFCGDMYNVSDGRVRVSCIVENNQFIINEKIIYSTGDDRFIQRGIPPYKIWLF